VFEKRSLHSRFQLFGQLFNCCGEERQFGQQAFRAQFARLFQEVLDGDVDKLVSAGVGVAVERNLLEEV